MTKIFPCSCSFFSEASVTQASNAKKISAAILIIFGLGCLFSAGMGTVHYFQSGSLTHLEQVRSVSLMGAGGFFGILFLAGGIFVLRNSSLPISKPNSEGVGTIQTIAEVKKTGNDVVTAEFIQEQVVSPTNAPETNMVVQSATEVEEPDASRTEDKEPLSISFTPNKPSIFSEIWSNLANWSDNVDMAPILSIRSTNFQLFNIDSANLNEIYLICQPLTTDGLQAQEILSPPPPIFIDTSTKTEQQLERGLEGKFYWSNVFRSVLSRRANGDGVSIFAAMKIQGVSLLLMGFNPNNFVNPFDPILKQQGQSPLKHAITTIAAIEDVQTTTTMAESKIVEIVEETQSESSSNKNEVVQDTGPDVDDDFLNAFSKLSLKTATPPEKDVQVVESPALSQAKKKLTEWKNGPRITFVDPRTPGTHAFIFTLPNRPVMDGDGYLDVLRYAYKHEPRDEFFVAFIVEDSV